MKIHEYQAKLLFREFAIPVPDGEAAETREKALEIAERLGYPCVIKAQVHAGGRGKAGGIKVARSRTEAEQHSAAILGMKLVSRQSGPEGKIVRRVLIERSVNYARELYLGIIVDRQRECPVIIASSQGGMEIEEVAQANPDAIFKEWIHPVTGLLDCHIRNLAYKLDMNKVQQRNFACLLKNLYRLFECKDASLVEVNPLVLTVSDDLLALDAKVTFDENALCRHADVVALRDILEEEPLEVQAAKYDLNYIKLDGNIGCMVNGAGLAMATMDMIKYYGGAPANFLDVGGGASMERVKEAFKIILADKNVKAVFVNIFGGIVKTDLVANGIVHAVQGMELHVPIVIRLVGTNEQEGRRILQDSGLNFLTEVQLGQAVSRVVALAKQGER